MPIIEMKSWTNRDATVMRVYFTVDGKDAGHAERRITDHRINDIGANGHSSADSYSDTLSADLKQTMADVFASDFTASDASDPFTFFYLARICSTNHRNPAKGFGDKKVEKIAKTYRAGIDVEFAA